MAADLAGRTLSIPDRWILSRLHHAAREVNRKLEEFRFDEAAGAIYAFFWHELCDGYLEMVKPVLSGRDGGEARGREAGPARSGRAIGPEYGTRRLSRCLLDSLALLHPFMPFVTEEIWEKATGRPGTLIASPFPTGEGIPVDADAERSVETLREIVTRVRNFRGDRGASPTAPVSVWISPDSPDRELATSLEPLSALLRHLGRLEGLRFEAPPASAAGDVVAGLALGLDLKEQASAAGEQKIDKELVLLDEEIPVLRAKLQNPSYVDKAPAAVVEKTRRRLVELEQRRAALSVGRT